VLFQGESRHRRCHAPAPAVRATSSHPPSSPPRSSNDSSDSSTMCLDGARNKLNKLMCQLPMRHPNDVLVEIVDDCADDD